MPTGDVAQPPQKARLRQAEPDVHQDGFENDGGDLTGELFEAPLNRGEIVERRDGHIIESSLGYSQSAGDGAGSVDIAVLFRFGLYADQSGVVQAVVRAFELENFVALGDRACHAAG